MSIKGWTLNKCTHEEGYEQALEEAGAVAMLAAKGGVDGDYQGGVEVVCVTADGSGLVVGWYWGSCDGCDDRCGWTKEEIAKDAAPDIKRMSPEALRVYLAEHFPGRDQP